MLLVDGLTWAEFRAKLGCSDSHIDRWSKRFATDRLEPHVMARTTKHEPADGYPQADRTAGNGVSHMTVTMVLPLFSGRAATFAAAAMFPPELMPAKIPSSLCSRRAHSNAS